METGKQKKKKDSLYFYESSICDWKFVIGVTVNMANITMATTMVDNNLSRSTLAEFLICKAFQNTCKDLIIFITMDQKIF